MAVNIKNINNILSLIRANVKKGVYPSTIFIQEKLNLSFYNYFKNIYEAYEKAGVDYSRPCPIILGKKKENILTNISIYLLQRMGYKIKRVSIFDDELYNRGEDIFIVDLENNEYLVELKAYGRTKRVTKREINQLARYVKNKQKSKGILITTSEVVSKTDEDVTIINGKELVKLMHRHRLTSFLEEIKWIQLAKVNKKETVEIKNKKYHEIIQFIIDNPKITKPKDFERILRLDLRTYFGISSTGLIEKIRREPNTYNSPACRGLS